MKVMIEKRQENSFWLEKLSKGWKTHKPFMLQNSIFSIKILNFNQIIELIKILTYWCIETYLKFINNNDFIDQFLFSLHCFSLILLCGFLTNSLNIYLT